MSRLSLAQRIVIVIAFGVTCLATGSWADAAYGQANYLVGWTGYAPLLPRAAFAAPLDATELLLVWIGIAIIWAIGSVVVLRPAMSSEQSHRYRWLQGGKPSIRHAVDPPNDTTEA
jgi:hypothetical protein